VEEVVWHVSGEASEVPQKLSKQAINNRATVFRGVRAEELSWRPTALTEQSSKRIQ
jgi:hypothetical protein